jgi:hypothetical protein
MYHRWSCRLWFFCAVLGAWRAIGDIIRTMIKLQKLRARVAAAKSSSSSSGSITNGNVNGINGSNRSIVEGAILTDVESLAETKSAACRQSVNILTNACDLIWSSSCAFESCQYNPALVASAALFTQMVGFVRYWRSLRTQLKRDAAAASIVNAK